MKLDCSASVPGYRRKFGQKLFPALLVLLLTVAISAFYVRGLLKEDAA